MTIGERIKSIRKEKGLTQKQVADGCGMADSAIRKYESGTVIPKPETLQRISAALGIHVLDLIGATNCRVGWEIKSKDGHPISDDDFNFIHSRLQDIRSTYDSFTDEEKLILLASAFAPSSEQADSSDPPQPKTLSESEILQKIKSVYGEATGDTFSMYVLLDASDQGEIRGEIKQMLKQGKYLKQEGNPA